MIAKHERISIRTRGKGTYEIAEEVSKLFGRAISQPER